LIIDVLESRPDGRLFLCVCFGPGWNLDDSRLAHTRFAASLDIQPFQGWPRKRRDRKARAIPDERYAGGEIDSVQHLKMRQDLNG
jgi:hypothetical protein